MKNIRRLIIPVVALAIVAIVAYPLYAQAVGKGIAAAKDLIKSMDEHKITLVKATEVAEKHESGGKAVHAAAAMHGKDLMFEVYTVKGEKIMLITVDGKTGKAVKSDEVKEIGGKPEKAAEKKDVKEEKKADKPAPKKNGETPKKTEPTKKP
jgi:hypothetical protein